MKALVLALAVSVVPVRVLHGQSRWERQVTARLNQAATTLGRGYRATGIAGRGALNTGESDTLSLILPAGGAIVLTGVCDDDCADLELSLLTNGYETDAARGSGNAPIVRVTPATTTTYKVTVRMASCRMNPCWFAVGVFNQVVTAAHPPAH